MNQRIIKEDTLMDAMGYIEDQYIEEALEGGSGARPKAAWTPRRITAMAAALAIFLLATVMFPIMISRAQKNAAQVPTAMAGGAAESSESYAGAAPAGGAALDSIEGGSEEKGTTQETVNASAYSLSTLSNGNTSLSFVLPEGWRFEKETAGLLFEEEALLGGRLYAPEAGELKLELGYYPHFPGICGTGISFTYPELENGVKIERGEETELAEGVRIYYFIPAADLSGNAQEGSLLCLLAEGSGTADELAAAEKGIYAILNTLTLNIE